MNPDPELEKILNNLVADHIDTPSMDRESGVAWIYDYGIAINQLQQWNIKQRIAERKEIALDNYKGHTFSADTNWQDKFEKFIKNNEKRLATLQSQLPKEDVE